MNEQRQCDDRDRVDGPAAFEPSNRMWTGDSDPVQDLRDFARRLREDPDIPNERRAFYTLYWQIADEIPYAMRRPIYSADQLRQLREQGCVQPNPEEPR